MPPKQQDPLKVLLVSHDIDAVEIICQCMQRTSVHVETCCDRDSAMRKLCHAKFEGVVIDMVDEEIGIALLRELRQFTSHKAVVAFALVSKDAQTPLAFQAGANFILERPLSGLAIARTIRAAYPLMVRERRRYFRCPWETRVLVGRADGQSIVASSINISEMGIALLVPTIFRIGERITMCFELPEHGELRLGGDVCWADGSGRSGIQFKDLPRRASEALQYFVATQVDGTLPAVAAPPAGNLSR